MEGIILRECNFNMIIFFIHDATKTEILFLFTRYFLRFTNFNIPFQNEQYGFVKKID